MQTSKASQVAVKEGTTILDEGTLNKDESRNPVISFDEPSQSAKSPRRLNRLAAQNDVIIDSQPIATPDAPSTSGSPTISQEEKGSPELTRRMSRTEAVRQDAIKLKSATLGRMGKMFKQHSRTPSKDDPSSDADKVLNATKSVENCSGSPTRKEKSNSLGRVFRLVDKNGSPRKLFHSRTGSLSRILRRNSPHNEDIGTPRKSDEDATPGIFSRMLNQLRGRPRSGNATAEPNIKARNKMSSLPPKAPLNAKAVKNVSPTSPPSFSHADRTDHKLENVEYPI